MGFRYLPHTADLQAVIESPDLEALYADAAALVREILVGDSPVHGAVTRRLRLEATDSTERFFRFVRELVYLYDTEGFLPAAVLSMVPLQVTGERFSPPRHHSERQIKALTRHEYRLIREPAGYRATLLFDL